MFKPATRPTTLALLDSLVPRLVCRAQALSTTALKRVPAASAARVEDTPIIHSKIRDQIMAQAHNRRKLPATATDKRNALVAQIQRALESRDLVLALQKWQDLETQRQTVPSERDFVLPESSQKALGDLLASQVRRGNTWDEGTTALVVDFALEAAARCSTEALHALMIQHIQDNNPAAVLSLYQRFCKRMESTDSNSEQERFALFNEEFEDQSTLNPGRISLCLVAVAAHAMNDSFRAALDTYLAANIRTRNYRKMQLLQHLKHDPALQQKVSDYIDRLETAAIVSRPTSLSKHIMNLAHPRSAKLLQKLYDEVYDGITGSDPYLAAEESGLSETRVAAMTEVGWTSFQTAFIRSERTDLAAQLWDDLARIGIKPGVSMWTALLDTYADLRDSRQAMLTWNMMLRQDVTPDPLAYRAIIAALFDDNKPQDAIKRFKEYQKIFRKNNTGAALAVYNTVLRGLLRINLFNDANALMTAMVKLGPKPDLVSYNTYIGYYSRQKDFKGLAAIINRMSEDNISGDVVTFSTILSALLQVGKTNAPDIIFNLMHKQGIKPNVATYTSIVDHLMRQQTEEDLAAALQLLDKMEQSESTKPNEVTYTAILSGLYRGQWVSRRRADEVRKDVVSRMRKHRIAFRLPTYHVLIRAAMESSDPEGHKDALALLQEMEMEGFPRTNTTWYIILSGLMQRQRWDLGREIVSKMYKAGHVPTSSLVKLVDEIRSRT
ncbi:hypothetical protein CVT26_002678 [Gymnopilus dilepis]|uniref:Pentatricopeptide repeat-containing protein-mitochondrial domain-containing protein n=1 Tax=Gymnopilus dilepis TaxID=231916 RepID=A0A409VCD2_9AGAR|nr:hypothetical protein CVT26_002678 [Gymnopilus dilepis]